MIHRRISPAAVLWGIASSILSLIVPYCVVQIIDVGIASGDLLNLAGWTGVGAVAQLSSGVCRYRCAVRVYSLAARSEREVLLRLYGHVMNADMRSIPDSDQGELMSRILSTSEGEGAFIEAAYLQGIPLLVSGVGTFIAMLALSAQLTLCSMALLPVAVIVFWWIRQKVRPASKRRYDSLDEMYSELSNSLRAMAGIRAGHKVMNFVRRFGAKAGERFDAEVSLNKTLAAQAQIFDCIQAVMLAAVFGIGGRSVIGGALSAGALVGFHVYMSRLLGLARGSAGLFSSYNMYMEGRARAIQIDDIPAAAEVSFGSTEEPVLLDISDLKLELAGRTLWDGFSMRISRGEFKPILMPSGSGKTSLARCILGLYPASGGSVSIIGGDPSRIGFVPQDNILFDGTIRDNISFTSGELDDALYDELVDIACLGGVSARLGSEGIGDMGARLSGGEQRRVMLARALAQEPDLLIIDQLSSELEPDLCRRIFENIRQHRPRLGVLYLGHRLPEW